MSLHIHFLDPYQPGKSLLHTLDARVKLPLVVGFILTIALIPWGAWPAYLIAAAFVLSAVILSGLGFKYVLSRTALATPFVLAALPVIFTTPGLPVVTFSPVGWQVSMTLQGMERFVSIALKSWMAVQSAILLAATTPFPDLLIAMRAARVPRLLVSIFSLMWRYLFVLGDEALRLLRARAARSGHAEDPSLKPGASLIWRARIAGGMAGSLFVRSRERSDRIYNAMLARGYDGEVRTLPSASLKARDLAILVAGCIAMALLLILAFLLNT